MGDDSPAVALAGEPGADRPDYSSMTLDQLVAQLKVAIDAFEQARHVVISYMARGMFAAMDGGDVLIEARSRVESGGWQAWLAEHFAYDESYARQWMRVAHYRPQITEWIENGGTAGRFNMTEALITLRGLPAVVDPGATHAHPEEVREKAREMHASGVSVEAIADLLGTSWVTVRKWTDDEYDRKARKRANEQSRRRKAARRALREKEAREERDRLAKSAGGHAERSYGFVRKLTDSLNRSIGDAPPPAREHLREAERLALKAEESLIAAMNEMRAAQ